MIGTRLGPYEITAKLGEGGMGEVYRATDSRLGREVAIKVLPPELAEDEQALLRFEREARAVAALSHPNILGLHDFAKEDGTVYAVMELLDGETLRSALASGAVATRKAVEYATQIARGLAAAHERGVVHRDLKPENVFITRDDQVKILDFGLAKQVQAPDDRTMTLGGGAGQAVTERGTVLGTVGYMAPEQVRGEEADARSDIFAFGAILYEMLSGRRAFRGDSAVETMSAILKEEPPELNVTGHDLPPGLERIVRHCLEKKPETRFQSARDIAFALESVGSLSSTSAGVMALAAETGHRRARWGWIGGLVVVAAILVAAGYFIGQAHVRGKASSQFAFIQETFRRQAIFNARFAPDGKTLVYSAAEQGSRPQLFIVRPEYPEPQPLGLEDTDLLSISSKGEMAVLSDARWVGHRLFSGTLGRITMGGGAPRDLMDNVRQADWSPDGSELAIVHNVAGKDRLEYPIGTVLYEATGYLSDLRVSPDGSRVAFFQHPTPGDDRGLVAVVDRTGKRTVLASGYWGEEGLAWLPSGEAIIFSAADQGGNYQMRRVDLNGRARIVLPTPGSVTVQDVSRDGRWLFTREENPTQVLVRAPGAAEPHDFSWLDVSLQPHLSSDGSLVALSDQGSTGGPNYTVLLRKTDGSDFIRLGEGYATGISPDRRWVSAIVPSTPQKIMLYPTGTGEPRRVDHGQIEAYDDVQWFPDGKSLLVCGNEPGHVSRCYQMPLDGGELRPVTPEGTIGGRTSPDGRQVCALTVGGDYRIYPLDGGKPRIVPSMTTDDQVIRWSPDGKALWVYSRGNLPARIDQIDLATGGRSRLETIEISDQTGVLSVISASLADNPETYAYGIWRYVSHLFVAEKTE